MPAGSAQYESLDEHASKLKWYQKTMLFAYFGGLPAWSVPLFAVSFAPFAVPLLISKCVVDAPGAGEFDPDPKKSYATKVFIITTVANACLTILAMWINVFKAAAGNSFSKNPEDWNTGDMGSQSKLAVDDDANARWARIHGNLLENVPLTSALALAMLFCKPSDGAVNWFMAPYPVIRLLHMMWYAIAGSHEVRATLFSFGIFCNCGCMTQCGLYLFTSV